MYFSVMMSWFVNKYFFGAIVLLALCGAVFNAHLICGHDHGEHDSLAHDHSHTTDFAHSNCETCGDRCIDLLTFPFALNLKSLKVAPPVAAVFFNPARPPALYSETNVRFADAPWRLLEHSFRITKIVMLH